MKRLYRLYTHPFTILLGAIAAVGWGASLLTMGYAAIAGEPLWFGGTEPPLGGSRWTGAAVVLLGYGYILLIGLAAALLWAVAAIYREEGKCHASHSCPSGKSEG